MSRSKVTEPSDSIAPGARTIVLSLARQLDRGRRDYFARHYPKGTPTSNASLGRGNAGIAVFYSHLARAGIYPAGDRIANLYLQQAFKASRTQEFPIGLFQGASGLGWAAQHLTSVDGAHAEGLESLDSAVLEAAVSVPAPFRYSLMTGIIGLGVYALERLGSTPIAEQIVAAVVGRLAEVAERAARGITWRTPDFVARHMNAKVPCYNLGIANGVPGAIAFLSAALAQDIAARQCKALLRKAVPELLRHTPKKRSGFTFEEFAGEHQTRPGRLGWCFGDLGVALGVWLAGRATGRSEWQQQALELVGRAARLPQETIAVDEAAFCHGSSGVAHLYLKFTELTDDPAIHTAARYWLERTLGYARATSDCRPLPFRMAPQFRRLIDGGGLIDGNVGTALVLLQYCAPKAAGWDRVFLLSARGLEPQRAATVRRA